MAGSSVADEAAAWRDAYLLHATAFGPLLQPLAAFPPNSSLATGPQPLPILSATPPCLHCMKRGTL